MPRNEGITFPTRFVHQDVEVFGDRRRLGGAQLLTRTPSSRQDQILSPQAILERRAGSRSAVLVSRRSEAQRVLGGDEG